LKIKVNIQLKHQVQSDHQSLAEIGSESVRDKQVKMNIKLMRINCDAVRISVHSSMQPHRNDGTGKDQKKRGEMKPK